MAVAALVWGAVPPPAAAGPVAAGSNFTIVAMPDQTVVSWGINGSGQLGHGDTTPKAVPTTVSGLTGVVAVAAGANHALALTSGGLVYAWGLNTSRQLGDGTTVGTRTSPVLLGLTDVIAIAAGDAHSIALTSDGNLWVWGLNSSGQLGTGNTTTATTPTQVVSLANVTAIAADGNHTLVRKSDGTAWAFGSNGNGQLGIGNNTTNALSPTQMSGIAGATDVAAGALHSVVLLSDGTVKASGYNNFGALGNGSWTQSTSPVAVTGLTGVASIAAGGYTSGAIKTDGTVRLWGLNTSGQVGDASTSNRWTATALASPTDVGVLAIGTSHTLAVTSTGVVSSWGANGSSELGDGTTTGRLAPAAISDTNYNWKVGTPIFNPAGGTFNVEKTVTISDATPGATIHYTLNGADPTESDPVVASGGTVLIDQSRTLKARAWNGAMPASNIASAVYTLQVATPTFSPSFGTYATPQTVSLSTTSPGATIRYEFGPTTPTAASPAYTAPLSIATTTTVRAIGFRSGWSDSSMNYGTYTMNFGTIGAPSVGPSAGSYTTSASVTMSSIPGATIRYTRGLNNTTDPTALSPLIYSGPIPLTATETIRARAFHQDYTPTSGSAVTVATYTITAAAPTFTPTAGTYSAGTPITIATTTPGATIRYTTTGIDPTDTDPTIVSGTSIPVGNFTLKAKATFAGATTSAVTTAAYVQSGSATTAMIDGGGAHAVAVRADGMAFAWGDNPSFALGDGTNFDRLNPVLMSGASGITQVSGGETHTLLRRSDGRVLAVGANGGGRLGDGTTTPRSFPILSSGITTATAVSAGNNHSLVLLADGTVMAFGENGSGQLGMGDTTARSTPTVIPSLSNIVAVSAGSYYSLALTASGTVYAFGTNGNGQLGLGDTTPRSTPTLIASLSGITAVAAGNGSSAVLLSTGGVKTFGFNMYGQLGNGGGGQSTVPVNVSGLTDATAVAVGNSYHMLARRSDGTLVGWGSGTLLGAGQLLDQSTPIPIPGLSNIVGISIGGVASYAWSATGEAWSFGQNLDGRLGDSTLTQRYTPVPIAGPGFAWKVWTPTLSVAAGTYPTDQTVTVTCTDPLWAGPTTLRYTTNGAEPTASDATVVCGGTVSVAQSLTLRVNGWRTDAPTSEITTAAYTLQAPAPTFSPGTGNYATPQTVAISNPTPGSVVRYTLDGTEPGLASTVYSSPLAIGSTLTLKASVLKTGWTQSISGTASYWIASGPAATPTITPTAGTYTDAPMVTMATATSGATIRYTLDGTVPTAASLRYTVPFFVGATTTVQAKAFAAGMTPSATVSVVYTVDPAGSAGTPTMSPGGGRFTTRQAVTVTGPVGATLRYTTTGVDPTASDATVTSGGSITVDRAMVLKVRAFQSGSTASQVRRGDFVVTGALGGGFQHGVALKGDRTVWAWGRNDGSLPLVGDGSGVTTRLSPVQLTSIGSATAIAVGQEHTLVVKENGTVVAWGYGLYGRLGDNTGTTRSTPTAVVGLTNVVAVAAGNEHSLAVTASGQVYAWGRNDRGQLGNNTTTDALAPVLVPGVAGAVAVAAGEKFSLILTTDGGAGGHLWAFGLNDRGQLGDGTNTDRKIPVRVVGLSDVAGLAAGRKCAVARTADGRLFAWGANDEGEIGNGTTISSPTPQQVLAIAQSDLLEAGDLHVMITDAQGRQWHWGSGGYGQPGTGLTGDHPAPSLSTVVADVTTLGTGSHNSFIAKIDGSVWSSGQNTSGALGIGVTGSAMSWTATSGLTLATNSWLSTDVDGDGLNAWREFLLGTDPLKADTNGNGLPDGVDAATGQPAAHLDPDGDGVPTARESAAGTDPYRADTDGDGVLDGADLFPLDPTRSALPPPTPGDTTPPVITLIEPTNAVPIP